MMHQNKIQVSDYQRLEAVIAAKWDSKNINAVMLNSIM